MAYFRGLPFRFRTVWLIAFGLATVFLLQAWLQNRLYIGEENERPEFDLWREVPVPFLNFLFWSLLLPLVYRVLVRWPLTTRRLARNLLALAGFGVLIGAVHELTTSVIYYSILWKRGIFLLEPKYFEAARGAFPLALVWRFMEYWVLIVILAAVIQYQTVRAKQTELAQLAAELQGAQLNALRKQLQPHFLFNTLNTVSALMDTDVSGARTVLSRLGQLLRVTLDNTKRERTTLGKEIDYIGNYLGIESVRFQDRLQVRYVVPEDLHNSLVPSLILQPLVENSVKHGPDSMSGAVEIAIEAERVDEWLTLRVKDNGKGCQGVQGAMETGGIGLRNVRDRLQLLYGESGTMEVASPGGKGFHVTIIIPYEPAGH